MTIASVSVAWTDPHSVPRLALAETLKDPHLTPVYHSTLNLIGSTIDAGMWTVVVSSQSVVIANATFAIFPSDGGDPTLAKRFYEVADGCRLGRDRRDCLGELKDCETETDWSSVSPDKKTDIRMGWDEGLRILR